MTHVRVRDRSKISLRPYSTLMKIVSKSKSVNDFTQCNSLKISWAMNDSVKMKISRFLLHKDSVRALQLLSEKYRIIEILHMIYLPECMLSPIYRKA